MAKLNNTDGFITQGWMVKELGLTGFDLVLFAIINQFSQSKAGIYKGGVSYLCDWTGMTKPSVRKHLKKLEEAGLIKAERGTVNNVQFCHYTTEGVGKKLTQGRKEINPGGGLENNPGVGKNLTPDTYIGKQDKEVKGKVGAKRIVKHPSIQEVADFVRDELHFADPEGFAQDYVTYNNDRDWIVENTGKPILNWKNHIRNNCKWAKDKVYTQSASSVPFTKPITFDL